MKVLLFIISLLLVQAASAEISPAGQQELLYFLRHDCGSCHGMNMNGGLGPPLLPKTLQGKATEFLVNTILEGRAGTAMPPWKSMLSHDEAVWLALQLKKGNIGRTELAKGATQ